MNFKDIELFLLDMDGTIYLENTLIDGAKEFLEEIIKQGKKYIFLTNNSSKSANVYLDKLHKLGIKADLSNIFTSGQATAMYLKEKKENPKVYLSGTDALCNEFINNGITLAEIGDLDVDYLVMSYDTQLNYEKLTNATRLLWNDTPFIATNCDTVCPVTQFTFLPDCGSFCKMLETATGKKPFYVGKPNPYMVEILLKKYNIAKNKTVIVGDRLYTDVKTGINSGINAVCVLSGEVTIEEVEASDVIPTVTLNSVKDIYEALI